MSGGTLYDRRGFFGLAAGSMAFLSLTKAEAARRPIGVRSLAFDNLHTGEKLNAVYWENGRYHAEVLRRISWVLRDHHNNKIHRMDPKLLDLLHQLRLHLHTKEPFQIISGYRSPETNASLAATTDGVAHSSLHMEGKAADIRIPGRNIAKVHRAATSLRLGGVGYYPASDFVHVDTGRVRYW